MKINLLIGGYGFSRKFIEDRIEFNKDRNIYSINAINIDNPKELYRYIKSPLNITDEGILRDIYIIKFLNPDIKIDIYKFIEYYIKNPIDNIHIQNHIFLITEENITKGKRDSLEHIDINIVHINECDFYIDLKKDISKYFIKGYINKCWDLLCSYCNNDYEKIKLDRKKLELYINESGKLLNEYRLKQLYSYGINYNLIQIYINNKDNIEGLRAISNMDDSTLYILIRSTKDRLSIIKKDLIKRYNKETNKEKINKISKKIIEINYIDKELTKSFNRKYKKGIIRFYAYTMFILNK